MPRIESLLLENLMLGKNLTSNAKITIKNNYKPGLGHHHSRRFIVFFAAVMSGENTLFLISFPCHLSSDTVVSPAGGLCLLYLLSFHFFTIGDSNWVREV